MISQKYVSYTPITVVALPLLFECTQPHSCPSIESFVQPIDVCYLEIVPPKPFRKSFIKKGIKGNYEINLPDLHKIAEQRIKGKGDFTRSIMKTE